MEFKIYTVPFSAYPRVQYACKHLEPLLRRYDDLNQLEQWDLTPIETPYRDYINKQTFQLCLQSLKSDRDIDIRNVTKQNDVTDCSKEKCANVKELARKRCLQNSFVIIVAFDINKDDIPADYNVKIICPVTDTNDSNVSVESPDATKRVQYIYKEQLHGTVSTIMELNLFKALEVKSYCERLLHILDGVFNSDEVQEKGICDKNDEIQIFNEVSSLQRSKSVGYVMSKADNILDYLKRSKSDIERSLIGYTDILKWKVKSDYNLKQRKKQKGTEKDSWRHLSPETIQRIERLSDEMLGMFSRSSLPENERPQFIQLPDKHLTEQLKEDLKNESSSIRSCGYRGCTLVIFVDNDCDTHNLETCLKNVMKKHKIASFSVEPLNIKEFCKVGSKAEAIFSITGKCGTLGGFGCSKSRSGNVSKTIGLVSRHVVTIGDSPATRVDIHCEGKTTEATVDINNSFADQHEIVLDIASISFKEDTLEFDTTYKTSESKRAKGVLSTYTTEQMKGLPVQICGACTPLGRGTVTMPKIEGVRDRCMDENFIFVEDNMAVGKEKKVFCKELDSGAIVCTDDQDNPDKVQLISMVIGGDLDGKGPYATLKLKEGIKQVEEETDSTIELL